MAIHYALFSGVSGLTVNTDAMGVISNNIANSNTRAFKADRAEFEDLLAINLNEHSQLGRGARLRSITTNYTQVPCHTRVVLPTWPFRVKVFHHADRTEQR